MLLIDQSHRRGRGGELKCYIQTDRHTDRYTYRPSDEVGPRGAFAPKNPLTFRVNVN